MMHPMIDHLTLTVPDLVRSRVFYGRALGPLGYAVVMDFGNYVGFGAERKPAFWLKEGSPATQPTHLAFRAPDRFSVDAFHREAIAAGATDDGPPGVRAHYHPNYYGAFVK